MSLIASPPVPWLAGLAAAADCGPSPTVASLDGVLATSRGSRRCVETLAALIALGDADLILDLSAVEFLDTSTVAVLLRAEAFLGATRGRWCCDLRRLALDLFWTRGVCPVSSRPAPLEAHRRVSWRSTSRDRRPTRRPRAGSKRPRGSAESVPR